MLVLLRGCPGSGKSTLARNEYGYCRHLEADMYFVEDGEYKFDPSKLKDAHAWCQRECAKSLGTDDVVVSNTFTKLWELKPYLDMAEELGVEVRVIHLTTEYESVHPVPAAVIERMKDSYEPYESEYTLG